MKQVSCSTFKRCLPEVVLIQGCPTTVQYTALLLPSLFPSAAESRIVDDDLDQGVIRAARLSLSTSATQRDQDSSALTALVATQSGGVGGLGMASAFESGDALGQRKEDLGTLRACLGVLLTVGAVCPGPAGSALQALMQALPPGQVCYTTTVHDGVFAPLLYHTSMRVCLHRDTYFTVRSGYAFHHVYGYDQYPFVGSLGCRCGARRWIPSAAFRGATGEWAAMVGALS